MRVTMTRTQTGSPDGIHIYTYVDGQTYDLNADLAQAFLGMGVAVDANLKPADREAMASLPPPPEVVEPKGERRPRKARK